MRRRLACDASGNRIQAEDCFNGFDDDSTI
jgi:hypothetical protein